METTDNYTVEDTSSAKLQATQEGVSAFVDAGYGLSVHWGLYALSTESNEWIMFHNDIPYSTYKKRMNRFNPERFNADEWADLMLEAGMRFLVITSKHHDGFCLWDTQFTDFKVTNTPFKRDILAELADALHRRGLGLHFYYSLVDWTHPDYKNNWTAYIEYYQNQLKELCTSFDHIDGIVFDGYWPRQKFVNEKEEELLRPRGEWDLAGTYDLIHDLQPHAMVANNTHVPPLKGEDYQLWELDLPGENTFGFNCTEIGDKPTVCWWNINHGWSYQPWNHDLKTSEELFTRYKKVKDKDAVFFLNVGPRSFGDIHPREQQVLHELAQNISQI